MGVGKLDEIRELAEKLGGLRERRRNLDLEIKELEASLAVKTGAKKPVASDAENQILGILDKSPDQKFGVKAILAVLPDLKAATIRAAFSRLHGSQKIERPGHGTYQSLLAKKQA